MPEFIKGLEPPLFARQEEELARLTIDRVEFLAGMKILKRTVRPSTAGEALLRLEGADAIFDLTGCRVMAGAKGRCPNEARFSGHESPVYVFASSTPSKPH